MTTKQKIELFRAAFAALSCLDDITWTRYSEKLLAMCLEEEKGHRNFAGEFARHHTPDTIGSLDLACMFAVKRIAEYLNGEKFPRGKLFLHCQTSCFYAAGIVDEYRKVIRRAWRKFPVAELAALDYCEFVKTRSAA